MERSNYHISLDIQDSHSGVLLNMKQRDTHRRITITLTDGGRPYALREGCYGVFTAKKPDGAAIFNDCQILGNTLIYDVTPQTTAEAGELACEVRLYGTGDKLLTCAAFGILVSPAVVSDDDDIASLPEATTLARLLDRVEQVEDFMDDTTVSDKAWSAKKLVDTLCPPFTLTGSVVTCRPVELYPLTVEAEGTLTHCGKNLIVQPYPRGSFTNGGVTFTVGEDLSVTVDCDGISNANTQTFLLLGAGTGVNAQYGPDIGILPGETYTMSAGAKMPTDVSLYVYLYTAEGALLTSAYIPTGSEKKTFTVPAGAYRIYCFIRVGANAVAQNLTLYPQLEKGNTAAYEPYRCETVSPGTVTAYPGVNTFFCNGGEVTVSGRKDIISMLEGIDNGN